MIRKFYRGHSNNGGQGNNLLFHSFEFSEAMNLIRGWLKGATFDEQIAVLDFVLESVREDVKTDLLTAILYYEVHFEESLQTYLFPAFFYDENGNQCKTYEELTGTKTVSLSDDCVWVMPWDRSRLRDSIFKIFKEGFKQERDNHRAYYYTHLDICHVVGGMHSAASAVAQKKGFIEAQVVDISKMFDHVHTDGKCWYNSHDGTKLRDVDDFRIAIMFETAKMKHRLLVGK